MIYKIKLIDCVELASVSKLTVEDKEVYILEDTIRNIKDKIYGETAIPGGKYKLSLVKYGKLHTWLSQHELTKATYKGVIMLNNVEGFSGVCFHPGKEVKNTEGCPLPICDFVREEYNNGMETFVSTWESSFEAYNKVYPIIADSILREDTYFEIDRRLN